MSDYNISGRIVSDGYMPLTIGLWAAGTRLTLGAVALPGNPLMEGVSSFDGGSASYHAICSLVTGSTLVASYSNGVPLIAFHSLASRSNVVGLNFNPVSDVLRSDLWDKNTDGARIMANAIHFSIPAIPSPLFSGLETKNGFAHGNGSTIVNYTLPTAVDHNGDPLVVYVDMAPGVAFPVGQTTVHASATDSDGRTTNADFTVSVTYKWSELKGELAPSPVPARLIARGQILHATFDLIGKSHGITNVNATLYYENVQDGIKHAVGTFKFTKPARDYELSWNTSALHSGTYRLTVDLGDGAPHKQIKIKIVKPSIT